MTYTYSELKQAIQDYTENDETTFVNNLNNFIKNTEERILKSVQLTVFRKNATGTTTSGNQFLAAPTDFLAPFSLSITNGSNKEFLLYKDVNFVQSVNPNSSTTGTPKYYGYFDVSNFILAPTPNANFTAEIHYLYRPDSLTTQGDSGTTWLSQNAPVTLLYGSLVEAYTFMKGEPDVIQNYAQQFVNSLGQLKNYGEAIEDTDAYRTGLIVRDKI
jgi:hypothetical protein|tara:strand:- start:807 stop:1454 length:648 start_codon:yes stop_codon:yes gene_type:complete